MAIERKIGGPVANKDEIICRRHQKKTRQVTYLMYLLFLTFIRQVDFESES